MPIHTISAEAHRPERSPAWGLISNPGCPQAPPNRSRNPIRTPTRNRNRGGNLPSLAVLALIISLLPLSPPLLAQEALRNSMAGDLAIAARRAQQEGQPYTFKTGDFRLLAAPSLGLEYNDNIAISDENQEEDFILRPLLDLTATYPITRGNLLRLRVGVGYDYYFENPKYSILRLESGSEVSFDLYVKDIWFNIHDRFSYIRDPGREAAIANSIEYGGFDNRAGLTATWDLRDVVLTLGYDHENFISASSDYEYLNRASELLLGRAGFQVNPRIVAGLEATGSFTAYDELFLNDNTGYSVGAYADWQPGSYFRVQPRAGYTAYLFDQTSRVLKAIDQDGYYAALTLTHAFSDAMSYSLSAGHELRLGVQADTIEDTYVRPSLQWKITRSVTLAPYLSYEHGTQGDGSDVGNFEEAYDWFEGGIGITYAITRKLEARLNYRYTLRSADAAGRDYSQNVVGLRFTYALY